MITKEEVFQLLQQSILHIDRNFNSEEVDEYICDQLLANSFPLQYSVLAGITKAAILVEDADFVIKMPFFTFYDNDSYSCAHYDWSYDRESALSNFLYEKRRSLKDDNYTLTPEEELSFYKEWALDNPEPDAGSRDYYVPIEGADNINLGEGIDPEIPEWDYCHLESVIYQLAVQEGVAKYFAKEEYLGTIDQTPVYYQEKCVSLREAYPDHDSVEYCQKRKRGNSLFGEIDIYEPVWLADFVERYGEAELHRLCAFLDKYSISDLRDCNIGYLNGAPILFDYSGYRGW